jgi:hypothetical protein
MIKQAIQLMMGLAIALFLTGCVEVTFDQPQPPKRWDRRHMPKSWTGTWVDAKASADDVDKDKIIVTRDDVRIVSEDITLRVGENTHLRWFDGFLVFSILQEDGNGYVVQLAKREKDRIALFEFDGSDEAKVAIWDEVLQTEIEKTRNDAGKIKAVHLSPENNAAFRKLIAEGGLTRKADLVRVAD